MRTGSSRGPRICPTLQRVSPASSKRGKRLMNSSMATLSSRRARVDPKQRWMPRPNAAWRFSWRSTMNVSASSNCRGSRFAAGNGSRIQSSFFIGQPWNSLSFATKRAMVTGAYARRNSSSANVMTSGSSSSRWWSSGCWAEPRVAPGGWGEVPQRGADGRPGRVDPGDEQEDDHAADDLVVDRLPLDLDVQQVVGEVLTRVQAVIVDLGEDVLPEIVHSLAGARLLGDPFDHVVHELAEQFLILRRKAEHASDHIDRDV